WFGPDCSCNFCCFSLAIEFFPALLRSRHQLLHHFARRLASQRIFYIFAEDDGVTGNLLHASLEYLVVLAQKIGALGAVCHHRHHLAGRVLDRALQHQLRNHKTPLAAGAVWLRPVNSAFGNNRAHKWISASVLSKAPGGWLGFLRRFRGCGAYLRYLGCGRLCRWLRRCFGWRWSGFLCSLC